MMSVVRERERKESGFCVLRDKNTQTKGIIGFIIIPGKERKGISPNDPKTSL